MPKGKKISRGYATVSEDDDCTSYREISQIMTKNGYRMNHASARNHLLRIMKHFARTIAAAEGVKLSQDRLMSVAKDPSFQSAISELIQNELT